MKNINKLMTLALSCLMLLGVFACGDDDLSTNQYQKGVHLNVFGPSPVVRGGTLRFLGSNLDQVKEVIIPGVDPITDITVRQAGVPSEIMVQVPKDGPEEGYVKLITASGEEITTQTKLTYSETIEFTGFSPAQAMPGDVITIKGDYLNLIHEVIFAGEVAVPETAFLTHTRYEITVAVPEEAQSGEIIISDGQEDLPNWIYSETELTVGTATVEVFSAARLKAGETLTVSGADLNLTASVKFNGAEVFAPALAEEGAPVLTVSEDGKTLTLAIPAEAASGDVVLVMRSGVEVPVATAEEFQVVVPTDLAAAPAPVKAGAALTISGKDLDLVTGVVFPMDEALAEGAGEIEFTAEATKLVIAAVPDIAQEGDITLNMANGMSVTVPYTLVKPVVTEYNPSPVTAGGMLTLTGTDLDLVVSVNIGGGSEVVPEEGASATSLTVEVPMDSQSGVVTLTLKNGATVEAPEISVNEAVFCYATELPGEDVELQAGSSLTLTVVNGDKLTGVEINGVACQYVLADGNRLIIGIPDSAGAASALRLVSSNGEITYTLDITPNTEVNTVIWTGAVDLAGWSVNWQFGDGVNSEGEDPQAFAKIELAEGDVIHLYATPYNDFWQIQFFNGHWEGQTSIGDTFGNGNNVNSDIASLADGCLDITVTAKMLEELTTYTDWGYCWIMQGEGVVITKITVTHYNNLEQDLSKCIVTQGDQSALMPFPIAMSWGDDGRFRILIDGEPSIKDMKLVVGKSTVYFYVTGTGQLQINDANWSEITTLAEWEDASTRVMEMVLTQDMVDCLTGVRNDGWSSTGLIVQGDGMTVSKITILP